MSYLVSFCSCVFQCFYIAITSLGEEKANLSAFRTFVRFVFVWICRFPLPLGVWEGLRFVIVELPGLFSHFFFTICLWLGPPRFNYWFSFTLAYSRISHKYSSLFIIVINLIFMFSFWCIDWVRGLYANRMFMYFCIKSSRVKLAGRKIALNTPLPRWFILLTVLRRWSRCYSYSLLLWGLFYEVICFMSYLVLFCSCVFLVIFSPFTDVCSICGCLVLSVSSSSWCLRRAAVCDCRTPWTFLLPFFTLLTVLRR